MILHGIRIFLFFLMLGLLIDLARSREIDEIIIHTTDMVETCEAKCIDKYHRETLGWDSCGYHLVIMRDGIIEKCRDFDTVGAHVKDRNAKSIGVAWAGQGSPTKAQLTQLYIVTKMLMYRFDITKVSGHLEYNKDKTCPNINMEEFRSKLGE